MSYSNNSDLRPVKYSLIQCTGNDVSKMLGMDDKDEWLKPPELSANISSGFFWTYEAPADKAVDHYGESLRAWHGMPNLVNMTGHHPTLKEGSITVTGSRQESPTCVGRNEAGFGWRPGFPTFLPIDFDMGFDGPTADEPDRLLIELAPYLAPYRRFWKPSSSSHVVLTPAVGQPRWVNRKFKWHCFFAISDAAMAKEIGADIFIRSFEGPHGYVKVGVGEKRCLLYDLSLIDNTIYTGSRELFESGAILTDPRLSQPHVEYSKFFGEVQIIDVKTLPKLRTMEQFKVSPKRARLRAEKEPERIARNQEIAGPEIARLVGTGMEPAAAARVVAESQKDGKIVTLYPDFELMLSNGRAFRACDVYTDPSLHSAPGKGIPCRDPMEPGYSKTAGKLYAGPGQTSGEAYINSLAHGVMSKYRIVKWPPPIVMSQLPAGAVPFPSGAPAPQGAPVAGAASYNGPMPPPPQDGATGPEKFDPSVRQRKGALPAALPVEHPRTRQEFVDLITATDPSKEFEKLTAEIPAMIAAVSLTEAECEQLFKLIAKMADIAPAVIRRAHAKAKSNTEGQDPVESMHLIIASKVIRDSYDDGNNIAFSRQGMRTWNGSYWEKLDEYEVFKKIHLAALALGAGGDLNRNTVSSIYSIIETETFKAIEFDKMTDFINVKNGELHLVNGSWKLLQASREHYRTSQIPVAYDRDALAPVFNDFLDSVFEGDPDIDQKAECLLELIGYTLTTRTNLDKFVMTVGKGANGKSVVFGILKALLGSASIAAVQPSEFENKFQRGHLLGKLANVVTELQRGKPLNDGIMKALVSGEMQTAEHKQGHPFDFSNYATMWFGCNELPPVRDYSDGLFRRTIILEFNRSFGVKGQPISATSTRLADAEADPRLRGIERNEGPLAAELPGILNMALEALRPVLASGLFTMAASSDDRLRKWHHEHDTIAAFIDARCAIGGQHSSGSTELYQAYRLWAGAVGIDHMVGHQKFIRRVKEDYGARTVKKNDHNDIQGVGLKVSGPAFAPTPTPGPAPYFPVSYQPSQPTKH